MTGAINRPFLTKLLEVLPESMTVMEPPQTPEDRYQQTVAYMKALVAERQRLEAEFDSGKPKNDVGYNSTRFGFVSNALAAPTNEFLEYVLDVYPDPSNMDSATVLQQVRQVFRPQQYGIDFKTLDTGSLMAFADPAVPVAAVRDLLAKQYLPMRTEKISSFRHFVDRYQAFILAA